MTDSHQTLTALDAIIQSRSILQHPFYVAWQKGELTRGQLATYARVYWPHVAAFPSYLEAAAHLTDDPVIRTVLEENLNDERTNPKPHPELWLDFTETLGQPREAIGNSTPHESAERIVETFTRLTRSSTAAGVAALYAYEVQQPEVANQKRHGLREFYGIDSEKALAYFDVHAEADVTHSQGERTVLQRCLETGNTSAEQVLDAATDALDAYWALLDGVCEEAGLAVSS